MQLTNETEARDYVARRCTPGRIAALELFVTSLREANSHQNLVSSASLDQVWQRHIADSAQLLDHVPRETGGLWLDLGTGAGLPGLVLATMQPDRQFVLIESRKLRINWLREMIAKLGLANCKVAGSDITAADDMTAATISARAFAPLDRLLKLSARFSTHNTAWVLPKGRSAAQEVASLPAPLRALFHVEQSVTNAEAGIVVGLGRVEVSP